MKRVLKITTILFSVISMLFALTSCKDIPRNIPTDEVFDDSEYVETFRDDFNTFNDKVWRYATGSRPGHKVDRHIHRGGYYSNDDDIIYVKDGNLVISTKYKNGRYGEGWYSAWIESTHGEESRAFEEYPDDHVGFNQKYGYFEIRCIAPPAEGMWSAFWLLPDEGKALTKEDTLGTATDGCEIDVMESQNYFRKKPYVQHVLHCDYGTGNHQNLKSDKSPIYKVSDMYSSFHTYGVEWDEDKMTFYIDGYKTYETSFVVDGKVLGTPKVPESIILSVEIAGHSDKDGNVYPGLEKDGSKCWLGNINNMDRTKSYDFVVDYVKVMQKKSRLS